MKYAACVRLNRIQTEMTTSSQLVQKCLWQVFLKEATVVASFFRLMGSWFHNLVADALKVLPSSLGSAIETRAGEI